MKLWRNCYHELTIEFTMKDMKSMKFNTLGKLTTVHRVHPMGQGKSAWSNRLSESHFFMPFVVFMVKTGIFRPSNCGI
jgi:hypothetical protein